MYEPVGLGISAMDIHLTSGLKFDGLIYLPSRNITFPNSAQPAVPSSVTMVFNQANFVAGAAWQFSSSAKSIAAATSAGPGSRLIN